MKQPLSKPLLSLLCVGCLLFLIGCADDSEHDGDSYIPSLITDMVDVLTDANGTLSTVRLDDGSTYSIAAQQYTSNQKETLLRCRASYTLDAGDMKIYSLTRVFCDNPIPADSFVVVLDGVSHRGAAYLPRDPMKVISAWRSGGYVNLHLGLMTTGQGTHQYAFCEDSVGCYSLVHLRPAADAESYTEHVYMSMPVPEGKDSLIFSVYTYDGIYTRTF